MASYARNKILLKCARASPEHTKSVVLHSEAKRKQFGCLQRTHTSNKVAEEADIPSYDVGINGYTIQNNERIKRRENTRCRVVFMSLSCRFLIVLKFFLKSTINNLFS